MKPSGKLNPITFLASFFGIGFLPKMPGTWGSLAAFGLYLMLLFGGVSLPSLLVGIALFCVFCLLAVVISTQAERTLGHDSGHIVIDEVCGYILSVMFLPQSWLIGLYGFALFRVFDIAKPWPVSASQNLPRGWGVVMDDLLAGVYANIIIQILIKIYPKFFGL